MSRGLAGQLMKCGTEPARVAKPNIDRNRGDRAPTIGQQLLGPFDSPIDVVSARRDAEGTLKRP